MLVSMNSAISKPVVSRRAQWILDNYRLEQTAAGWRAVTFYGGKVFAEYIRPTREEVIRLARCQWSHFNFEDEAEAFNSIFPRC